MSHSPENNICPNCGFITSYNYCAKCGQETHLHNETFLGMVMHFIGHYIHYDSKFWQTLKSLLFSPGKLTIAYLNKQRMRYIPPISLYIFISAVFFLIVIINPHKMLTAQKGMIYLTDQQPFSNDSIIHKAQLENVKNKGKKNWYQYDSKRDTANLMHFIYVQGEKLDNETEGNSGVYILEHLYHTLPKIFFFLIPLMAFFLKLLFLKKKDVYFTTHSVFSLHYHSFVFVLLVLLYIPFIKNIPFLPLFLICLALTYLAVALHNVYNAQWVKAVFYSLFLGVIYTIFLFIAVIVDFFAILYFV